MLFLFQIDKLLSILSEVIRKQENEIERNSRMMTVKECYESMEADFEGVIGRMGSGEMVKRFALKFLDDPSYSNLEKAIQEQNAEEAFRAAHTIKGLCLNLGFDRLYKVSAELTEKLRGRELDGYEALYGKVQTEYKNTIDAIRKIEE